MTMPWWLALLYLVVAFWAGLNWQDMLNERKARKSLEREG